MFAFLLSFTILIAPTDTPHVQPPTPVTIETLATYQQTLKLTAPKPTPKRAATKPHVHVSISYSVEQWRPLVEKYFKAQDVPTAMRIMQCESRGDPNAKNPHSSASGLFQHLARYWPERSAKAGWAGADIFDPEANIAVAAWLKSVAGWRSWTCY